MARVCVVREGDYPWDPRVRNEVDALVGAGHAVDVICLRRQGQPARERFGPVLVRRLSLPGGRGGWARYLSQYALFTAAAGFVVGLRHLRRPYDVVQVNTMPDTLVFAALIPKLLGARVLLDLHESMPEFTASKFSVAPTGRAVRLVAALEQLSIRFANFAITPTAQQRQAFVDRGAAAEKVAVIMNTHGLTHAVPPHRPPQQAGEGLTFRLICHGTIEERYGLDTLVRAAALLRDEIPGLRVDIYGDGSFRRDLLALIDRLDLGRSVYVSPGFVPFEDLLAAIGRADAGVVAMKRDAFRDLTLCNKMFDFIGLGKPAIVSRTRAVEEYFGDACFEMFTADDPQDLARAIRRLHGDPARGHALARRARQISELYNWTTQRAAYLRIVAALAAHETVSAVSPAPGFPGEGPDARVAVDRVEAARA